MDFIELVNNLNNRLEELNMGEAKFQLDTIICSHPLKTTILGYAPSIINDRTLSPPQLTYPILCLLPNLRIIKWMNRKYMDSLHHLLQGKRLDYRASLVRLRIAACMATGVGTVELTNEEKEEWRQHITDIFYKRNLVIMNYYFEEIEKLPF